VNTTRSRERERGTAIERGARMNIAHRLPLAVIASAGFFGAPACHSAHAAETAKMPTPSIDIEVEDRAPGGGAPHTARFNVSLSNGHADITAADGDAHYALSAQAFTSPPANNEPKVGLKVKRTERAASADIEVSAAIPQQPGGRILVARIDRADGHVTTIVAQSR
jgi:hypothetical protein